MNVHFGCSIIKTHKREESELRKLHEAPLRSKLGLNINCPRDIMHISKEMLRLGLFLLSMIITMKKLLLFLGNKQVKSNVARIKNILEEQM